MSKDPSTEAATVPKDARPLDVNAMELVFGTPNSPKMGFTVTPDVHSITNERTGKSPTENLNNNNRVNNNTGLKPSAPLLEPHIGKPNPPLAGPEVDDLDDRPADAGVDSFAGIDDGLLEPADKKPDIFHINGDKDKKDEDDPHATADEGVGTEDGKWLWPHDETDYPYDGVNGFDNRFGVDDRAISPLPGTIPDVNTYQQKKNLAQGMMDLALLSANANQLRYVIESSSGGHPYYYSSIIFISLSIVLQIAVGIGLILNSRYNVKDDKDICKADKINNMTVLGVFLITIVNVFITSFSVAPSSTGAVTSVIQQAG